MSSDYEYIPVRRLLNNVVSHHEILSRNEDISPQDFLREIRQTVISFMRDNSENKIRVSLICDMMRTDSGTGNVVSVD